MHGFTEGTLQFIKDPWQVLPRVNERSILVPACALVDQVELGYRAVVVNFRGCQQANLQIHDNPYAMEYQSLSIPCGIVSFSFSARHCFSSLRRRSHSACSDLSLSLTPRIHAWVKKAIMLRLYIWLCELCVHSDVSRKFYSIYPALVSEDDQYWEERFSFCFWKPITLYSKIFDPFVGRSRA